MPSKLTYTLQEAPPAVLVSGPTFPFKEKLKALGFSWDPARKLWILLNHTVLSVIQAELESPGTPISSREIEAEIYAKEAAKAKKIWERSPEGKKARVLEALKDRRSYYWVCCESCEVIDWREAFTYCKVHADGDHAFRIRGQIFTGD